jgi:thymidylate kinase
MAPDAGRPHPVLQRLFAALEDRRLSWSLLRVPSNLAAPSGDLDVLVAPEHSAAVREAAEAVGFVALPGWTSAPNMILVHYDRLSDCWLVLDVVTSVSFHSPPGWRLTLRERDVLRRRELHDGVAVPAGSDAFWLLLLHCLLDKRFVPPHYRTRLKQLAPGASRSVIGRTVVMAAGDQWSETSLVDAVLSERWEALEEMAARLAADLRRRRAVRERARALATRALATARKPLLLSRRTGVSLAVLGPDGVGKSTAVETIRRSFPFGSRTVYMGLWKSAGGGPLRARLEVLARPLRLWARYAAARYHQLRGRLVLFDRYVYEAWLPANPPFLVLKNAYYWLLRHSVPSPDLAVVLDVPGRVAYARKGENSPDELEWERRIYRDLAARLPSVHVIDASRDADAVRADITSLMWERLVSRWHPNRSRVAPARTLSDTAAVKPVGRW